MANYKFHYVYRITELVTRTHYYGDRSCNCHPKDDIGVKYFSSFSNYLFKNDQQQNPHRYRYKVIKIFKSKDGYSRKNAKELEVKLHLKFDVKNNKNFINRANQTSSGFCSSRNNIPCTADKKKKISATLTGRKRPEESIKKSGIGNPMYGKNGIDNPKSLKHTIINQKNEIVCICYGAEIKQKIKEFGLPTTFRYQFEPYLWTGNSKKIFEKFNGWYIISEK